MSAAAVDLNFELFVFLLQLGEYNIPSALVSRYIDEMDCSTKDISLCLEDIRRSLLSKCSRKYVSLFYPTTLPTNNITFLY